MEDRPLFNAANFAKPAVIRIADIPKDTLAFNPGAIKAKLEAERLAVVDLRSAPLGPLNAWSFSRLMEYESCPYSTYLAKVEKAPNPSGPAAERGTKIHTHIEGYIQGEHEEIIPEMKSFLPLINHLRDGYNEATVQIEGDWAFRRDWTVTGWTDQDCWARVKLDAIEFEGPTSANVIDWKTGKKFGNELKHNQQAMTYAIAAFYRYPELEYVSTKMAYLDKSDELTGSYTRAQAMMLAPMLTERADKLTTATKFPPKPSFQACRWCPHGKVQEGRERPACDFAYENSLQ